MQSNLFFSNKLVSSGFPDITRPFPDFSEEFDDDE